VRECQPDVLILDVDLVGQSGLDLLETAKVLNPAILVIMLTNHDHPLVKQRCADLGADFFFHKSTEFEKVLEVCREFIETRAAGIGSSPVPGSGYFNSGAPGAKEAP
jgi:DNA-binding NarL/FixJ family response regulator